MSAIRVDSPRLIWLEVFTTVAAEGSYSEAARQRGLNQSSVSRYMRDLQAWLGKDLVERERDIDMDLKNPQILMKTTAAGDEFLRIAGDVIDALRGFRSQDSERNDLLNDVHTNLSFLENQLILDKTGTPRIIKNNIEQQRFHYEKLKEDCTIMFLEDFNSALNEFLKEYELRKAGGKKRIELRTQ